MIYTFILWLGFSLIVGSIGRHRNIGFGLSFLWAILLSPVIGLAIALFSKPKIEKPEIIDRGRNELVKVNRADIIIQLEKISNLKEKGVLNEQQYEKEKTILLEKLDSLEKEPAQNLPTKKIVELESVTGKDKPKNLNRGEVDQSYNSVLYVVLVLVILSMVGYLLYPYFKSEKSATTLSDFLPGQDEYKTRLIGKWETVKVSKDGIVLPVKLLKFFGGQLAIEFKDSLFYKLYLVDKSKEIKNAENGLYTLDSNRIHLTVDHSVMHGMINRDNSISLTVDEKDKIIVILSKVNEFSFVNNAAPNSIENSNGENQDNSDYYFDSLPESKEEYKTILYYRNKNNGAIAEFNKDNFPWKDTLNWEFVSSETVKIEEK